MSKLLIFSFNGTSNEPSDAEQSININVTKQDDNNAFVIGNKLDQFRATKSGKLQVTVRCMSL